MKINLHRGCSAKSLIIFCFTIIFSSIYSSASAQMPFEEFKYNNKNGKLKTIRARRAVNMDLRFQGKTITLYEEATEGTNGYVFELFVRRKGEEIAQYIGRRTDGSMKNLSKGTFRNLCKKFFADYPDLVSKIDGNKKGYRPSNILKIVKEYDSWKSEQ